MHKHLLQLALLCTVFAPFVVSAETVLRTGNDISVESEQVVDGDYYVSAGFSGTVMSGSVAEDMYAIGAAVTINGDVGADAVLMGGTIHVHGPVEDDVRILGGEVVVGESVGGDLFVLGGNVSILSSASIAGDVFVFGGSATIEGEVEGSIFGHAEQFTINSKVGKDVKVTAPAGFTVGDNAEILGEVRYESLVGINRAPGAIIEGEIQRSTSETVDTREQAREALIPLFISLFTALSLYLFFKPQIQHVIERAQSESAKAMLIGAGVLVAGPFVAIVLMATVLGVVIGIGLFGFLMLLYVVAIALTGPVLGVLLWRLYAPEAEVSLSAVILGTLLIQISFFIPVVGIFLFIVLFSITLGSVVLGLYRTLA